MRSNVDLRASCGILTRSQWFPPILPTVGLPAKSGVGGGIIAVVPGRLGIAVFSPPLDQRGNSVRGLRACAAIAERYALHVFAGAGAPHPLDEAVSGRVSF